MRSPPPPFLPPPPLRFDLLSAFGRFSLFDYFPTKRVKVNSQLANERLNRRRARNCFGIACSILSGGTVTNATCHSIAQQQ